MVLYSVRQNRFQGMRDAEQSPILITLSDYHETDRSLSRHMDRDRDRRAIQKIEKRGISKELRPNIAFVTLALVHCRRGNSHRRENDRVVRVRILVEPRDDLLAPFLHRRIFPRRDRSTLLHAPTDIGIVVISAPGQQLLVPSERIDVLDHTASVPCFDFIEVTEARIDQINARLRQTPACPLESPRYRWIQFLEYACL